MLAVSQNVFAYAPVVPAMQPMRAARSSVNMGVADMPGVSTETGNKVWDPLGLSDNMDDANLKLIRAAEVRSRGSPSKLEANGRIEAVAVRSPLTLPGPLSRRLLLCVAAPLHHISHSPPLCLSRA